MSLLFKVLCWLLAVIKPLTAVDVDKLQPLIAKIDKVYRTRGVVGLIEWAKALRLAYLHFLSGEFSTKVVKGVAVSKDGFPRVLGPYVKANSSNITLLRLVFTLLFFTRVLAAGKLPNTKTITDPSSVTDLPQISKYAVDFWRSLGYQPSKTAVPRSLYWKSFHMTSKAGPNGHALGSSMKDFYLLITSHRDLLKDLKVIGGVKFSRVVEALEINISHIRSVIDCLGGTTLRKISYFSDRETKVRVVAILDYWSQTVLRAFHDYLFKVLRKIPQDCTFNQGKFQDLTKDWSVFYSYDLTAATDRFPISIIAQVLEGLLPIEFVQSWVRVMSKLPFDFKLNKGSAIQQIRYEVGNPMGAYSSWNSFAIAHHYIMYWCCRELGIDWKTSKYCLLGDDVLIGDSRLAEKYLEVILSLGVEISAIKSHVSPKLFEFAKRLFLNGSEITPFPISSLPESSKKFYLFLNLLREESRKGWSWLNEIPPTVQSFYASVLGFNATFCKKVEERSYCTNVVIDIITGTLTAEAGLNLIIGRFGLPLPELSAETAKAILSSTVMEVFVESNPIDYTKGVPLGQMAADLVCGLTEPESSCITGSARDDILCTYIPVLSVYGKIEDKYIQISRDLWDIDTVKGGEWPLFLRTVALPVSDRVFVERASHTVVRVGSVLGDKLLLNLRSIRSEDL